jgi:dihydrofolate synthase/folylpolyglutamate synthase
MNYKETTEWLFSQLPMFQNQGAIAYKNDLSNVILLDNHLNNPHKNFKTIHVAGTNGKGSTSSLLASVLQESGLKVGLYTSPHLKDFRERIKINSKFISEKFVIDFVANNKSFFESNSLSFFEMTVGMAFQYFASEKVDIAVIEVGMGGRLDATNIITPLLSVITNIGLDHTQFLGNTLEEIAFEKGGIIKKTTPVIIGESTPKTKSVFNKLAKANNASIVYAEDLIHEELPCALLGDYQTKNKKTVLTTLKSLEPHLNISKKNILDGFMNVIQNTGLLGRWQVLNQEPKTVCDTAHNYHGLKIVLNQLKNQKYNDLHIILGFVNDKDIDSVLQLFPKNAKYYFCKPNNFRGLDASILEQKANKYLLKGNTYNSVTEAYNSAKSEAANNDFIYIGGSNFIVAEIL